MAFNYFSKSSLFELTIELTDDFNEETAASYFEELAYTIKSEAMTQIVFKQCNDFFYPDKSAGILPYQLNKTGSNFNYRLKLPKLATFTPNELLSGATNMLNLTALKIHRFSATKSKFAAYAQITPDKIILLSRLLNDKMEAELIPVDRTLLLKHIKLGF